MPDLTQYDVELIERREYCDGLRAAADFFETHPEIKLPHYRYVISTAHGEEERPYLLALIRALGGRVEKVFSGDYIFIVKIINRSFKLQFLFQRKTVCERKVLGIKRIPEQVIAAHEEEEVEWVCAPALAAASDRATQPEHRQIMAPAPTMIIHNEEEDSDVPF
jgi:hypothetical protein